MKQLWVTTLFLAVLSAGNGVSANEPVVQKYIACPPQFMGDSTQAYESTRSKNGRCDDGNLIVRLHDFRVEVSCTVVNTILIECTRLDEMSEAAREQFKKFRDQVKPSDPKFRRCVQTDGSWYNDWIIWDGGSNCETGMLMRRIDLVSQQACVVLKRISSVCIRLKDADPLLSVPGG